VYHGPLAEWIQFGGELEYKNILKILNGIKVKCSKHLHFTTFISVH
jgi:hypothetical protein